MTLGPKALYASSSDGSLYVPGAVMLIVVIDGYGESGISGILCLFSIVNTDLT